MNTTYRKLSNEAKFWLKQVLGRKDANSITAARIALEWKNIMSNSVNSPNSGPSGKKVLFVTGSLGMNPLAAGIESFYIKALQSRGHECFALNCDKGIPSCEFNINGAGQLVDGPFHYAFTSAAQSEICQNCANVSKTIFNSANISYRSLNEFGESTDFSQAELLVKDIDFNDIKSFIYRNIKVGDHAFSSSLRVTHKGVIDLTDPYDRWVYRKQLISTIVMVDRFNRVLDSLKPEKVVSVHGVYLIHGTMAEVCKFRGIDVAIYGVPYRKGTVWFSHKETYHKSLVTESHSPWENLELTEPMKKLLDDYLQSKEVGGRDNINYHPNPIADQNEIKSILNLNPNLPIVSLFTNVIWDAQIYYQYNAFKNIFDWIFTTINYFKNHPKIQLAIRIHPAESKGGYTTKQPLLPEIAKKFPVLPPNVFIISSDSDISSYTLAEMSQATLIYGTKMGLEIATRGIPVIVAGETFNRGKGFTYDVETNEQYIQLLDKIMTLPRNSDMMIKKAKQFAYYLFFMKMIDMPLLNKNLARATISNDEHLFLFDNLEALTYGKCPNLDLICNAIIENKPFYTNLPTN